MGISKETMVAALVENAVTAPEVDTDTLADRIIAALDNDPANPADTEYSTSDDDGKTWQASDADGNPTTTNSAPPA
jgi:Neuraminidase (sialidase)